MKKFSLVVALVFFMILAAAAQFLPSQTNSKVPQVVHGKVTAHGNVIINGGDTGTTTLVGIVLAPTTAWVSPGGTQQYTATGTYSDGSTGDVTANCTWASSATGIATINTTGLATGVSANASPTSITCTDPTSGVVSIPASLYVSVVTITTTTCPSGTQNAVYANCNLVATGGSGVYTWSTNILPAGLTINSSTGVISGTPTALGTTNFNASVVDSNGIQDSQALSITVNAAASLTLQAVVFPQANIGSAYGPFIQTGTGGSGNYTTAPAACTVTIGSLPASIAVSSVSTGCQYQTTGTVTASAGTYTGTTQLKDSAGNIATQTFSITVASGPPSAYSSPWCHQNPTTNALSCPSGGTCDCSLWPVSSIPNYGGLTGKATCINDAKTGNRVMRLTDSSLSVSTIHNDDAGDSYTVNADDTMAFVSNIGGTMWIIPFDFNACTVAAPIGLPFHGQFWWDPDLRTVFYGINNLSSTVMQKCSVNTTTGQATCNPMFDFADNSGSIPHGSGGLLPGYQNKYIASPDGFSFYDGGTTYNPHHIWGLIFAGGPAWSQNGPYGTTWQVNWVSAPVNNNTAKNSFRVTSCAGACTGGASEPNWANCTTTCTDGNITWTNIGVHNAQDEPDDLVYYDSAANCFTHIDLLIGYVINTNCAGQSTGALTYLHTGQPAAAAGKQGAHGGGATPNSGYMQWDYSGSWRYVWAPGSMTVDYCQSSVGFCDAHSAIGSVGYYAWSGGIRLHPWNNINSAGSYPILFNPHSGHKFSYNNVQAGDTTPICSNTTQAGHYNLSYTQVFFSEADCFPTDGSDNIWRMFQTYNSMIHWSYHVQDSSTQVSRGGQHMLFTTDLEGTLGSDKGHNTCTAGQTGCSKNAVTGDTCILGGDGWKLSTAYTAGTVVNPGIVISTSGYPQAKGNPGHYAFKAINSGTSSSAATGVAAWCQTPPSSWGAGDGCTTVDNNITWQNIGQLDCRGDVFIGALN